MRYLLLSFFLLKLVQGTNAFAVMDGNEPGPQLTVNEAGLSLANVIFQQASAIRAVLNNENLQNVQFTGASVQRLQPLGFHAGVYQLGVQYCGRTDTTPCITVGQMKIWENIYLRPGQTIKTYNVEFLPLER